MQDRTRVALLFGLSLGIGRTIVVSAPAAALGLSRAPDRRRDWRTSSCSATTPRDAKAACPISPGRPGSRAAPGRSAAYAKSRYSPDCAKRNSEPYCGPPILRGGEGVYRAQTLTMTAITTPMCRCRGRRMCPRPPEPATTDVVQMISFCGGRSCVPRTQRSRKT